jgi:hypothetical protein
MEGLLTDICSETIYQKGLRSFRTSHVGSAKDPIADWLRLESFDRVATEGHPYSCYSSDTSSNVAWSTTTVGAALRGRPRV